MRNLLLTFFILFSMGVYSFAADSDYSVGQGHFQKKNFKRALASFEKYLKEYPSKKSSSERFFWVLDQVGYIHLRVNKDPASATSFFKKYEKDSRLDEAQQDAVSGWIAAANDWNKEKLKPSKIKGSDSLYRIGKKYFLKGLKKKQAEGKAVDYGNADFAIAETYLRPFIVNHDNDTRIGEVLLMMGRIKVNLNRDADYWAESFYLKEVIRRFPSTKIAEVAWKKLDEDMRFGYTGSGGDNTPESVKKMLSTYKKLAKRKSVKGRKN